MALPRRWRSGWLVAVSLQFAMRLQARLTRCAMRSVMLPCALPAVLAWRTTCGIIRVRFLVTVSLPKGWGPTHGKLRLACPVRAVPRKTWRKMPSQRAKVVGRIVSQERRRGQLRCQTARVRLMP